MDVPDSPSSPLTFSDFLPDDRTPERKKADVMAERFAEMLTNPIERDNWTNWQPVLDIRHELSKTDQALFDLALREQLHAYQHSGKPEMKRAVMALIFTEMDWWEPDVAYAKRRDMLAQLRETSRIDHLRPDEPAPEKPAKRGGVGLPGWIILAGVFLLMVLLFG